jgi:hypothetical protein
MIDLEEILTNLGVSVLPNAIQFIWVLMAFLGMLVIGMALNSWYRLVTDGPEPGGTTGNGVVVRLFVGALMVIPSITLWRAAEVFMGGGGETETTLLAYVSESGSVAGCDNFGRAITLGFMFMGALAILRSGQVADDVAKGFSREGYRRAVMFFIGGICCFFINDIMEVVGNELGYDVGIEQLCTAIGDSGGEP